jgi:hypothetical protein
MSESTKVLITVDPDITCEVELFSEHFFVSQRPDSSPFETSVNEAPRRKHMSQTHVANTCYVPEACGHGKMPSI